MATKQQVNFNMTSNNAPTPYVASASSEYSTSFQAWDAFNGTIIDSMDAWISGSVGTGQWLQMDLGEGIRIGEYRVVSRGGISSTDTGNLNASPKDWTFEGSNDGTNWTVLDTQTLQSNWSSGEERIYTISSPSNFRYYRLFSTANNGGHDSIQVGELKFYELFYVNKILLKSSFGEIETISLDLGGKTLDPNYIGSNTTLSNNNKTATITGINSAVGIKILNKGKKYWEVEVGSGSYHLIGIVKDGVDLSSGIATGGDAKLYYYNGNKYDGAIAYGEAYNTGDIISVLLDMDNGTIEFWKNGISQGVAFDTILSLGDVRPVVNRGSSTGTSDYTIRTDKNELSYSIPEGYSAYGRDFVEATCVPSQTEQDFINHGMGLSDFPLIDYKIPFYKKHYIKNTSTVLGSGKTFEQPIDMNKYKINKISFK